MILGIGSPGSKDTKLEGQRTKLAFAWTQGHWHPSEGRAWGAYFSAPPLAQSAEASVRKGLLEEVGLKKMRGSFDEGAKEGLTKEWEECLNMQNWRFENRRLQINQQARKTFAVWTQSWICVGPGTREMFPGNQIIGKFSLQRCNLLSWMRPYNFLGSTVPWNYCQRRS